MTVTECRAVSQASGGGGRSCRYLTDENSHVAQMRIVTEDGEQMKKNGVKQWKRKTLRSRHDLHDEFALTFRLPSFSNLPSSTSNCTEHMAVHSDYTGCPKQH